METIFNPFPFVNNDVQKISIKISNDPISSIYSGSSFEPKNEYFPLVCDFLRIPQTKEYAKNVFNDLAKHPIKGSKDDILNNLRKFHSVSLENVSLTIEFLNLTEYIFYLLHNEFRPKIANSQHDPIIRDQLRNTSHTSLLLLIPYIDLKLKFKYYDVDEIPGNLISQIMESVTDKYLFVPKIIFQWMDEINTIEKESHKSEDIFNKRFSTWLKEHRALPFLFKLDTYYFHNFFESDLYIDLNNKSKRNVVYYSDLPDYELYKLLYDTYIEKLTPRSFLIESLNIQTVEVNIKISENVVSFGNKFTGYKQWYLTDLVENIINKNRCTTPDNCDFSLDFAFELLNNIPDDFLLKEQFEMTLWNIHFNQLKFKQLNNV